MPQPVRFVPFLLLGMTASTSAAEPVHQQIDKLIAAKAAGQPLSPPADDAEFLRRVTLDLAGRIPTAAEARAFLADKTADKRTRLIDSLLASADHPVRMKDAFHVMLMERMGDNPEWASYLQSAFQANKPWDVMARDILRGVPPSEAEKGVLFFFSKRLEKYGGNPVDYPGLTRDVGRLFLGKNLQCAQCHDHLFIDDYKQADFQGLHVVFENLTGVNPTQGVMEKPLTQKVSFMSVFKKVPKETGPRVPGMKEMPIPAMKPGEEYLVKPDPRKNTPGKLKFSPLQSLAEQLPTAENPAFVRNGVNRIWFLMMGRGLIHPLDLDHKDNPPSHPEVLDLLTKEWAARKFDIRWLVRELALTQTYQRSSTLPSGVEAVPPQSFRTAIEKRLSAEQLMRAMLRATGAADLATDAKAAEATLAKFVKAFANQAREPEDEFTPSLRASLFVLNDPLVLGWLEPKAGNLVDRLAKLPTADAVADELYLSVLTRMPTAEEKADVARYLEKNTARKPAAVGQLAWALLASTEFAVNH